MSDPMRNSSSVTIVPAITDEEVEEQELALREKIATNFTRVHDIERELADLQLQLKMNIGPKKQAMEHMRRKIEAQTLRVSAARAHHEHAKKAYEAAVVALTEEEEAKQRLCDELSLLVHQANRNQLEKLQQLASRVDILNSGMPLGGGGGAGVATVQLPTQPGAAVPHSQPPVADGAAVGDTHNDSNSSQGVSTIEPSSEEKAEALRKKQAAEEAAAARNRHVSLNRGRGAKGGIVARSLQQQQIGGGFNGSMGPAKESRDENGAFRGFD